MKKFIINNYLEDIRKKIPAYDLMFEIIFNSILKVKTDVSEIKNILAIGGQNFEAKNLSKIYNSLDKNSLFIISIFSNKQLAYWKEFALSRGAKKEQVEKTFNNQSEVMNVLSPDYTEILLKEIGFLKVEKICEILSVDMWIAEK